MNNAAGLVRHALCVTPVGQPLETNNRFRLRFKNEYPPHLLIPAP
jgi:hypothetical protein